MATPETGHFSRRCIRAAGRLLGTLAFLVPVGVGCAAGPDRGDPLGHPELERPPVVQLLAGTQPQGDLIYEDWVTGGQHRTYEAEAVPSGLVAVPWQHGDPLTFKIGIGQAPSWAGVLIYEEIPVGRLPDTDPERVLCELSEPASPCVVDRSIRDTTIRITMPLVPPGELIILNVGWDLPESYRDNDPSLPLYMSASWAFAADPTSEPAA